MRLKVLRKGNLNKFHVAAIAVVVMFLALIFELIWTNYLTCEVTASLKLSKDSGYDLNKFKLILISQSGNDKEYDSYFNKRSDSCSIRVPNGEYAVGIEYDEELYLSDIIVLSDSETYMCEYSEDDLPLLRAVEFSYDFHDGESYSSYPSEIIPSVIDENGEVLKIYEIEAVSDNMSVILMDDECDTLSWTVSAEGYESVTIEIDQDDEMVYRVSELEVDLYEE